MMYQKKPSKVLVPGEPGSEKYMLDEGPRTFDMVGVDYFPEGDEFKLISNQGIIKGVSKGASWYSSKNQDPSDDLTTPDKKNRRKSTKIYGPRVRKNNELYSTYFKKKLSDRIKKSKSKKNLITQYWDKYRLVNNQDKNINLQERKTYTRRNKKKDNKLLNKYNYDDEYMSNRNIITIKVDDRTPDINGEYLIDQDTYDIFKKIPYIGNVKLGKLGSTDRNDILNDNIEELLMGQDGVLTGWFRYNPDTNMIEENIDDVICFYIQGEYPINYYLHNLEIIEDNLEDLIITHCGNNKINENWDQFSSRLVKKEVSLF